MCLSFACLRGRHLVYYLCCCQNFFPGVTTVAIGGVLCTDLQLTDDLDLGALRCSAPPGPGIGDVHLRVTVTGGGIASVPFLYAAPSVTAVSVAACPADVNFQIQVTGANIGLRNSATSPDPVVYVGDELCFQPLLLSLTTVQCTAVTSPVGAYRVVGKS